MFQSHANYALRKYLNPLWQRLSRSDIVKNLQDNAIILIIFIDSRPTYLLRFCVLNSLLMTGFKYKSVVYTSNSSFDEMCALFSDICDFVEIVNLDLFGVKKLDRNSYNALLKRSDFWSAIPASSILLTQVDALLIEPLPDYFFQYDYIGPPWSPNKALSILFPQYAEKEIGEYRDVWKNSFMNPNWNPSHTLVGNGGHSIRNIECMIKISSEQKTANDEPEDVFYASNIERYSNNLPSVSEAKKFACEGSYSFAFGAHASYLYLEGSHQAEIYERHIKHLAGIFSSIFS